MRPSLQKVIDELHLDTRDNFTRMFALASAMLDERDALRQEVDLWKLASHNLEGKLTSAEAENAALRERAEKYEAIAVAQTEACRKAEADNAALRQLLMSVQDKVGKENPLHWIIADAMREGKE